MNRLYVLLLVALPVSLACRVPGSYVPVHEEPLHRPIHEAAGFRVLDVRVPSGITSRFHVHDAPIAYVMIDASPVDTQPLGGQWKGTTASDAPPWMPGEVAWSLDYVREPLTHRVRTVGVAPLRLIALIHYGAGAAAESGPSAFGEVEAECAWFRVARSSLEPGEALALERSERPVVAVLVTDGVVEMTGDCEPAQADGPGAILVLEPDERHELRNSGHVPTTIVLVELR